MQRRVQILQALAQARAPSASPGKKRSLKVLQRKVEVLLGHREQTQAEGSIS